MRIRWKEYVSFPEVYRTNYKTGDDEVWYEGEVVGNGGRTSNPHFIVLFDDGRFRTCPLSNAPKLVKPVDTTI